MRSTCSVTTRRRASPWAGCRRCRPPPPCPSHIPTGCSPRPRAPRLTPLASACTGPSSTRTWWAALTLDTGDNQLTLVVLLESLTWSHADQYLIVVANPTYNLAVSHIRVDSISCGTKYVEMVVQGGISCIITRKTWDQNSITSTMETPSISSRFYSPSVKYIQYYYYYYYYFKYRSRWTVTVLCLAIFMINISLFLVT